MQDNLVAESDVKEYRKRSYRDLSSEFQRLCGRVQLIPLMYNRLTRVDKLSHKAALTKIYNDHQHLPGFSKRNIRRNLPLDNASVPRRIRPSWPKNSSTGTGEASELSHSIHEERRAEQTTTSQLEERSDEKEITTYVSDRDPHDKHNDVYAENAELIEALSRHDAFIKADEISSHEIKYTISKTKYQDLEEAMRKSRDSMDVLFDKSGGFERAIPDIYRGEISHV